MKIGLIKINMFQSNSPRLDPCGAPVTDLIHSLKFDTIFIKIWNLKSFIETWYYLILIFSIAKGEEGVVADCRMSTFSCHRTQLFIKQFRRPQIWNLYKMYVDTRRLIWICCRKKEKKVSFMSFQTEGYFH